MEATMTVTISSTEFQRNLGALTDKASREPVIITTHGREKLALIPIEDWNRLKMLDERRVLETGDMPDALREAMMDDQKKDQEVGLSGEYGEYTVEKFE